MFTHCVFFWLKEGMSEAERAEFATRLRALTKIPSVAWGSVGTPADTNRPVRPVVDQSYTWGLMVAFENAAGHDAYQVHPTHLAFREHCAKHFARFVVYDFEG